MSRGKFFGQLRPTYDNVGGNIAKDAVGRRHIMLQAATRTLLPEEHGALFLADRAGGIAITLPTAPPFGTRYEFLQLTSQSGGNFVVTAGSATELYIGAVEMMDSDSSNVSVTYTPDYVNDIIITLNGTTQGGLRHGNLIFEYVPRAINTVGAWWVQGVVVGSGAVQTPFS